VFLYPVVLIAAISVGVNLYLAGRDPSATVYLPLSRFWELMVGGILAYLALHQPRRLARHGNARSIAGFALLGAGLALIDEGRAFPGWWALLPTLGAFLIISAGERAWLNKIILSSKPMVAIGLISYPLYLWHWPLLTFQKIMLGAPGGLARLTVVLAAFALAYATYRYVEKPLRFAPGGNAPVARLGASLCLLGIAGVAVLATKGFEGYPGRDQDRSMFVRYYDNSTPDRRYSRRENLDEKYNIRCNFYSDAGSAPKPLTAMPTDCYRRDARFDKAVFIWGDSHAEHLYYGLRRHLPSNWQILQVATSGCAPELNAQPSAVERCQQSNWFAFRSIVDAKPDVVIVAQNDNHQVDGMAKIAQALEDAGAGHVLLVGPTPHWNADLPRLVARRTWAGRDPRTTAGLNTAILQENDVLKRAFKDTSTRRFVDLIDFFCNAKGCLTYLGDSRATGLTSWDYGHLSPIASDAVGRDVLAPLIRRLQ
jgi:hypothetical protein